MYWGKLDVTRKSHCPASVGETRTVIFPGADTNAGIKNVLCFGDRTSACNVAPAGASNTKSQSEYAGVGAQIVCALNGADRIRSQ